MLFDVTSVKAKQGYWLDIEFESGECKRFDMSPYLHYPVFRPLANSRFFALARAEHGTVVWPGNIDIDPETLYELSESLGHGDAV